MENAKGVIGSIDRSKPTVIWGAGISGLLIAYYLKKNNIDVIVKELTTIPGGKVSTLLFEDNVIEQGANALYLNEDSYELINELNLINKVLIPPKSLKRLIYKDNKVFSIFSQIPLYSIFRNIFNKTPDFKDDLTLENFLTPWIGIQAVQNLLDPALGGIYATKSNEVLLVSIFSFTKSSYPKNYWQFITKKRAKKKITPISGSIGFMGGMKTLVSALVEKLESKISFDNKDRPNFCDHNNIFCTDSFNAQELLAGFTEWQTELKKIQYNSLSSNTVLTKKNILSLKNTFGVVFVENKAKLSLNTLGMLLNHNIFTKNYTDLMSYTLISKKLNRSSEEIVEDLKLFNSHFEYNDIKHINSTNLEIGLPIYNFDRHQAINKLHHLARNRTGICLFGNYVAGISIREMITAAKEFGIKSSKSYV